MIYVYNGYLHKLITCFLSQPLARDKVTQIRFSFLFPPLTTWHWSVMIKKAWHWSDSWPTKMFFLFSDWHVDDNNVNYENLLVWLYSFIWLCCYLLFLDVVKLGLWVSLYSQPVTASACFGLFYLLVSWRSEPLVCLACKCQITNLRTLCANIMTGGEDCVQILWLILQESFWAWIFLNLMGGGCILIGGAFIWSNNRELPSWSRTGMYLINSE